MDDGPAHLSLDEVRRTMERLRQADIVRFSVLARNWARGLGRRDADDLLNEAFDRILSGRRPWPSDVGIPAFFNGVMQSIASQWRHEDIREPLVLDVTDGASNIFDESPSTDHELNDLLSRMRRALKDDPQAQGIMEQILADSGRDEAQAALGIDATSYDTGRRRMIRHLFTMFNSGWML